MKLIGNCKEFLDQSVLKNILSTDGVIRPTESDLEKRNTVDRWKCAGYDFNKIKWHTYNNLSLENKFILPPFFNNTNEWWFVKLNPGDIFPYHLDSFDNQSNVKRYWVACDNHKPGHLFSCGKFIATDFLFGDIFLFDAANVDHGAVNIGFDPFVTLQICMRDNV